jgi:hypothetical protein
VQFEHRTQHFLQLRVRTGTPGAHGFIEELGLEFVVRWLFVVDESLAEKARVARLLAAVSDDAAGANGLFVGTTRGMTAGVLTRPVRSSLPQPTRPPWIAVTTDFTTT